jgi:hypothetical protein
MVTNKELNDRREAGCWAVFADKMYFRLGNSCMKRTLRRHEWQSHPKTGRLVVPPASYPQRWKTDAAILQFLAERTDIPLPHLQYACEDDGAFCLATEYVEGVSMSELGEEEKRVVIQELLHYVEILRSLKSDMPGVPGEELLCTPQRLTRNLWKIHSCWRVRESDSDEKKESYVFCHNDLGQHNVIVDPKTLKINAIIDWEFGGFWPEWFERPYWERRGPSSPLEGEEDDIERCRQWLTDNCDEVVMPHLGGASENEGSS